MNYPQTNLTQLKTELKIAREKLEQAWREHEGTTAVVLEAGEEFDALLNQYICSFKVESQKSDYRLVYRGTGDD